MKKNKGTVNKLEEYLISKQKEFWSYKYNITILNEVYSFLIIGSSQNTTLVLQSFPYKQFYAE